MAMKITTLQNLEIGLLEPHGSIIGGDETDELKQKARDLLDQGNKKLVIDLGNVTYLNSTGIGAIVSVHTMYAKAGGKIKVSGLGKGVKNVFVITSLIRVIDVEETKEDAINNFQKQ